MDGDNSPIDNISVLTTSEGYPEDKQSGTSSKKPSTTTMKKDRRRSHRDYSDNISDEDVEKILNVGVSYRFVFWLRVL